MTPFMLLSRAVAITLLATTAPTQAASLKLADSFRIGTGGVLCTAQSRPADPALKGMFDRGYQIVCRDAATPVGSLYALRGALPAMAALLPTGDTGSICEAPAPANITGLPGVTAQRCTVGALTYLAYFVPAGTTNLAAVGLAGYASALQLGLRSLAADGPVSGDVEVAVTEAGDAAAFGKIVEACFVPVIVLGGAATDDRIISNNAMPCQQNAVRKNDAVANLAIMRNVRIGEESALITHNGGHCASLCTRIHCDAFADGAICANHKGRGFAFVFQILRLMP